MALEQKLHLKLAQRLVMTPTLQQAIKLLQLSRLELEQTLSLELQTNPLLEMIEETPGEDGAGEEPTAGEEPGESEEEARSATAVEEGADAGEGQEGEV
ncbi:MAG: RNA polymerase sigma-54 factor, partial [Acidobacteriota bacterium]